ncbi:MAG: hypothetical protein QOI61_2610 [Actinomycetota bacterium]
MDGETLPTSRGYTLNSANWVLAGFTLFVGGAFLSGSLYFLLLDGDRSMIAPVAFFAWMTVAAINWVTSRVRVTGDEIELSSIFRTRRMRFDDIASVEERRNVAGAARILLTSDNGKRITIAVVALHEGPELRRELLHFREEAERISADPRSLCATVRAVRLVHVVVGFAVVGAIFFLLAFATDTSAFRLVAVGCQIIAATLLVTSSRRTASSSNRPPRRS